MDHSHHFEWGNLGQQKCCLSRLLLLRANHLIHLCTCTFCFYWQPNPPGGSGHGKDNDARNEKWSATINNTCMSKCYFMWTTETLEGGTRPAQVQPYSEGGDITPCARAAFCGRVVLWFLFLSNFTGICVTVFFLSHYHVKVWDWWRLISQTFI